MQALRTAATGMAAQQLNVEVISNNIANMNTVGFKRQRAEFQDLLYQTLERAGSQSSDQGTVVPTGLQVGAGVKAGSIYRIVEQGAPTQTGNDLDLLIQGRGYLRVLLPTSEIAYTRAGNLSLNDQGQLVTAEGYEIQPGIVIPPEATDISISKSGQVQIKQAGATAPSIVGNLELATFVNEAGLEAIGDNLYLESGSSGAPNLSVPGVDGTGVLLQGYTEASNVDAVSEVTALIIAQRAYEMNSKVIKAADEMLSTANQVKS
ncbi:MAG: flagellar basal-body rod protein FlgG [Phenylobacterium sp.]|uniref:flagellar basal-body rod protein FlgG n=1 Tax=Phenylobacterium sp. TaxID=1871053 RepID=UPI003019FB67